MAHYILFLRVISSPGCSLLLTLKVGSLEDARMVVARMRSTLALRAADLVLKGPDGATIERSQLFEGPEFDGREDA